MDEEFRAQQTAAARRAAAAVVARLPGLGTQGLGGKTSSLGSRAERCWGPASETDAARGEGTSAGAARDVGAGPLTPDAVAAILREVVDPEVL